MSSRRMFLKGLMAASPVGTIGCMSQRNLAAERTFTSFVSRDGMQLHVDGEPFYFNAANAPWLTHTYPSKETVDKVMAFANDLGLDVLRAGIHSVDVSGMVHSPKPGQLGEEAFKHVDYMLQQAERHGIRMVFSLVDNWDYYGGMDAYVANSPTASEHDDFYTDDQCRRWYKEYVSKVLSRENTLTGRVYKDDPTVLMWELTNEAEAKSAGLNVLHNWYEEMAAYVKGIDATHLLSTGSGGNYNTDSDLWMYSGGNGVDYVRNHQIPEIDVCSFHLYPEWAHSDTKEFGREWIREHFVDAHETIGKPAFLGEFGWAKGRTPSRPDVYADWFNVVDELDGAGAAAWQVIKESRSETSKHDIRPSDSDTVNVLSSFSAVQRDKGSQSSGGSNDGSSQNPSLAGERLDVEGGGADIWGTADQFHFASEQVRGNATLVARVSAQENTDPWAKAGVMVRDSLAAGSPHAIMALTPEQGVAFQHRSAPDATMAHVGAAGMDPYWVKIERVGETVTGYASPDGTSWTEVGSATVSMTDPYLGLAVTSHSAGTLSTARFEKISGTADSLLSTWSNHDIGGVDVAGSVRTVADTVDVSTESATDVSDAAATLHGLLADLGGASSVDVYFEYGPASQSLTNRTAPNTRSSTGNFSANLSRLDSGTEYGFRAVAEASDGTTDTGTVKMFTMGSGANGTPTVDAYSVTETGEPNPHAEMTVDWTVSDPDGDLSSVEIEVFNNAGLLVDSATANVSGSSASGSDRFKIKHGGRTVYTVDITVIDGRGNRTSRSQQVSS